MRKSLGLILVLVIVLVQITNGCSPKSKTSEATGGIKGSISVNQPVVAATASISPNGGTIIVNQPDNPLNGLELTIPQGSYSDIRQIKISYAQVEKHTFGEYFNPITPLIKVENCEQYSEEVLQVKIPVQVPAAHFAMGFYYDEKTKTLEGMPLLAVDENSIIVMTRHFSDFIISTIDILKLKKDIDTDFKPGADDWQFGNEGSYINPGGYCSGVSLTELWYYETKPDGPGVHLYGRYDNNGHSPATPSFWQDDSLGIRLVAVVQDNLTEGFAYDFWSSQRGLNDELTWNLLAYSMQLTGQPQLVGIANNAGEGHSMVCYCIKDGNLYIADPNHPGNLEKRISYTASKFSPYTFEDGTVFNKIGYRGKSSTVDWGALSNYWADFKAGTIGKDVFPSWNLSVKNDDEQIIPLIDGYTTRIDTIAVFLESNRRFVDYKIYRDGLVLEPVQFGVYNRPLKPGNNKLGFYIKGDDDSYVDFKYINVKYDAPTPTTAAPSTTIASIRPVITSFNGPDKLEFDPSLNIFGDYTFSLAVTGGKPPYYFTWKGVNLPQVLLEGSQYNKITIAPKDMRQPGGISDGFFIWVTVKDSAGQHAIWTKPDGFNSTEFCYSLYFTGTIDVVDGVLKVVEDKWKVVTEPTLFPSK